jgi:phosphoribosyl 1,2-cyclic phosphodiesterase
LLDCGLNLKALKARLALIGQNLEDIDAIFITHEHSDHIQGLKHVVNQYDIPILCNAATAEAISHYFQECIPCHLFTTYEPLEWKDLSVLPFSVSHDAVDPVGFRFESSGRRLGVCADIGFVSALIPEMLSSCDLLYIESNHDPLLVHASKRPLIYKQRVLSKMGHLSNEACGKLVQQIAHPHLRHVYLAHLSQDCNDPKLAQTIVKKALQQSVCADIPVEVALQEVPSSWVYSCDQGTEYFSRLSTPKSILLEPGLELV